MGSLERYISEHGSNALQAGLWKRTGTLGNGSETLRDSAGYEPGSPINYTESAYSGSQSDKDAALELLERMLSAALSDI